MSSLTIFSTTLVIIHRGTSSLIPRPLPTRGRKALYPQENLVQNRVAIARGRGKAVVKPDVFNEAERIFENTAVQISTNGRRHLGVVIGTQEFIEAYVSRKVLKWVNEIESN